MNFLIQSIVRVFLFGVFLVVPMDSFCMINLFSPQYIRPGLSMAPDGISSLSWSANHQYLAVCSTKTVRIWRRSDLDTIVSRQSATGDFIFQEFKLTSSSYFYPNDVINCHAWHPDSNMLVIGSRSGVINVWDVAAGKLVHVEALSRGNAINSLTWSADGHYLFVGCDHACGAMSPAHAHYCEHSAEEIALVRGVVWVLTYTPDKPDERLTRVWAINTSQGYPFNSIDSNKKAPIVAIGTEIGDIMTFSYTTDSEMGRSVGTMTTVIDCPTTTTIAFNLVKWSPDGQRLAVIQAPWHSIIPSVAANIITIFIFVLTSDGKLDLSQRVQQSFPTDINSLSFCWTPNGRELLIMRNVYQQKSSLTDFVYSEASGSYLHVYRLDDHALVWPAIAYYSHDVVDFVLQNLQDVPMIFFGTEPGDLFIDTRVS